MVVCNFCKKSYQADSKSCGTSNGRKKSLVWNHFEKVKVDEGVTKAIFNYCKKIISC